MKWLQQTTAIQQKYQKSNPEKFQ